MTDKENIVGSGGKGGGGGDARTATIANDSLSSSSVVKVLFAIGEGEMGGLVTNDARSIRFNNTPLMNTGGSYNYNNVTWATNPGTPAQSYIPGFSTTETYFPVSSGTQLTNATPYTLTTSGPNIDAVRVDVTIPALSNTNTSNGDVTGTTVEFSLYKKTISAATWVLDQHVTINDKSSSPVTLSYLVENPSGQRNPSDAITTTSSGNPDSHFSEVTLLMHFEGTDLSTDGIYPSGSTFAGNQYYIDSSNHNRSCTSNSGGNKMSTAQAKFGSSSGLMTANTAHAPGSVLVDNADGGFEFDGDFTVEAWTYLTATYGYPVIMGLSSPTGYWSLRVNGSEYEFDTSGGNVISTGGKAAANLNQWTHVAVSRIGAMMRLYVNGVICGIVSHTGTIGGTGGTCMISSNSWGNGWQGYLDEIRVTKGTGRYYDGFGPAGAAFPDNNTATWATWNDWVTNSTAYGGTGGSTWQVQVRRDTEDNGSTYLLNSTFISGYTEVQDVAMSYPNTCVLGIQASAKDIGNSIPTVSGDWYGRLVKIPSNYNPTTRVYTGGWNGSFATVKQWTNNPAWVLYDMLTEPRAGLGVAESTIDKWSFYDAAVYNDELVSDGNTGTEPRYTFNGFIAQRLGSWEALNQIAATMHGRLITTGQIIKLVQDRPASPVALITNSNVISDGETDFTYATPSKTTRFNACKVTLNDPDYSYQVKDVIYNDTSTGEPYLQHDVNGFGITSEGQARRLAKWYVHTSLYDSLTCSFKVGAEFATLEPFDVIKLMDTNIAGSMLEGRVVSTSGSTVTLDRQVTIGSGTWSIDAIAADGVSIETRTITSLNTTTDTLTLSSPITSAANSAVIITGSTVPQTYRILSIKENKNNEYDVNCIQYNPAKYSVIENGTGTTVASSNFFATPDLRSVSPVTNFVFHQVSVLQADGSVQRFLDCDWSPLASDYVVSYIVSWTKDNGPMHDEGSTYQPRIRIPITVDGTYKVNVIAVNAWGKKSIVASGTYNALISAPVSASTLPAVTGLQTAEGSTTAWFGSDLKIKWVAGANTTNSVLKDFVIQYADATNSVVFKTAYVVDTNHVLYLADNTASNGGAPKRNIIITVRERDNNNMLSSGTTITVNNAAPAAPTNIQTTGMALINVISWTPAEASSGVIGYMVWGSKTNGFTPDSSNLLSVGSFTQFTHNSLTSGDTWYYKVAAYDSWGHASDGTGLNVSSQFSRTVAASVGIPSVPSAPTTGTEGDLYFNTTDGKLYRYHSGAWTAAVAANDLTGQLSDSQLAAIGAAKITGTLVASQIADATLTTAKFASTIEPITNVTSLPGTKSTNTVFNTTDGKLYRWNGSAYVATVAAGDLSGTIGDAQLAAIAASKITGTLSDTQLAAISAAKITGSITSTQITDNSISTAKIAAGAITTVKIATDAITANEIAAGAVSTTELAAGAVTAAKITAGTITSTEIAASTITGSKIAANTITGSNIAANTITASNIAADTITAGQIAAGAIGASEISAGAITANKLLITPASGGNLWFDANFADTSAWQVCNWGSFPVQGSITDGVSGGTTLRSQTGGGSSAFGAFRVPVTIGKLYKASMKVRNVGGNGTIYLRLDGATSKTGAYSQIALTVEGNAPAATPWSEYSSTWVATVPWVSPMVLLNYGGTAGYTEAQDIRIEELTTADLIVDGAISAAKIAAGSITSTQIAADTITASNIASGAITASELAAGAVTTAKLAAGAVTANEIAAGTITAAKIASGTITGDRIAASTISGSNIAAGTITGDRIAAGSVTASNIDSRSLTIKDAAGTVLFGSGTALDFSNVGGATKPANNATVGATFGVNVSGQITSANSSTYIAAAAIGDAQIGGNIQSSNYNGTTGWLLDRSGNLFANSGTFKGDITGSTGTFSGTLAAGTVDFASSVGVTNTYSTPGTYSITVPAGMTRMRATLHGGGGGGGGGSSRPHFTYSGGGGGSGGYVSSTVTVVPGQVISLTVGAGGAAGYARDGIYSSGANGSAGGSTTITGILTAAGGNGGLVAQNASTAAAAVSGGTAGTNGTVYIDAEFGGTMGGNGGNGGASSLGSGGTGGSFYSGAAATGAGVAAGGGGGGMNSTNNNGSMTPSAGGRGNAVIEFYDPNGVVLKSAFDTLKSELRAQGHTLT